MAADTRALDDQINSVLALLGQFSTSLSNTEQRPTQPIDDPPNPLRVLCDSAKLVKAHATKISLLAITKPFTPSAVGKVLKELNGTCLPAMMSAVQICGQEQAMWGKMMGKEVQMRVQRVFKELEMLLGELKSIAAGNTNTSRRDSLSSTGVVWESCDALIALETLGVGGLAVQKAKQYRETIQDALKELQEWKDGDDLDFEGQADGLGDSDDEGVDGDKHSLEDIFNAANSMPKGRPELEALVEEAEGKLKKVVILYQALVKRRLQTFQLGNGKGAEGSQPAARLDNLMVRLKRIPHQVDELVGKFYELEEDTIREALQKIIVEAKSACECMNVDWAGQEDECTSWLKKWTVAVG